MSKYEAVLVLSVKNGDEANGTLESVDEWGKRKLAYEINDEAEGHYVIFNFDSEPAFPAEFERVAGITDGVLRTLVVKN